MVAQGDRWPQGRTRHPARRLPSSSPQMAALPDHDCAACAVLAKAGLAKTPLAGAQREMLKRWFWCAVFGQAYESAANTRSAEDVVELSNWVRGGAVPETVSSLRFDPKSLRDVTPRQRSIYRGTICLILGMSGGARDFHGHARRR